MIMQVGKRKFDRALIVAEPWIDKILSGEKVLEMRTRHTTIHGRIGLIRKGSGLIVGDVWLGYSIKVKDPSVYQDGHLIDYGQHPEYSRYNIAWPLSEVNKYYNPIPYNHPKGAVIWVKV
jgi:hypothetical protein